MVILLKDKGRGRYNMKYLVENGKVYSIIGSLVGEVPFAKTIFTDTGLHNTYPYNLDLQIAQTMQEQGFGVIVYNDSQLHNDIADMVNKYNDRKNKTV